MKIEVYYFSGTGNSLQAARELCKHLPESELIPIVRLLHSNQDIRTRADCAGLVFPNFCLTIPIPVYEFVNRMDFSSVHYLFAVCTRGGSPSQAFDYLNQLLAKQNKRLNACLNVTMPWNHPLGKEDLIGKNTPGRVAQMETDLQSKADGFGRAVLARGDWLKPDTEADLELSAGIEMYERVFTKSFNYSSHDFYYQKCIRFYSAETCNGCGLCEKVCLNHKIEMIDGRPHWKQDVKCYACFACINYCPRQSIQIASRFPVASATRENGRYHHPEIGYRDIAAQR